MKKVIKAVAAALGVVGAVSSGQAQTLKMMKSLDAPHYDGHRTTWSPASDIINMIQDTLVALDWDGKTVLPYLAKSWEVSEDGTTYTFKLRDDVQSKSFAHPTPIPSYTSSRRLSPTSCCSSQCTRTPSTTRRASRSWARTTASTA